MNKLFIGVMMLLVLVAGCNKPITSFDECVAAGNPVMESYPEQCRADGKTFVNDVDSSMKLVANIEDTPAIIAARAYLVEKYNVDEEKFLTIFNEEQEWTDGCLGLGGPAESCLAAITPGYKIILTDMDFDYVMRTDANGNSVREESRTEVENGILR